jgi:hypothetical protein
MRPFEHEKVLAFQKASKSGKLVCFKCFEECVIEKGEKREFMLSCKIV